MNRKLVLKSHSFVLFCANLAIFETKSDIQDDLLYVENPNEN